MRKFKSTRGSERELTGAQAIIQGIAEDKGLYVPAEIPTLPFEIEDMIGKTYQEIAHKVIGAFFDDYTEEELSLIHIYGSFDRPGDPGGQAAADGYRRSVFGASGGKGLSLIHI